ncbi:guanine-N(7)-methyltransferase domain-containing protein [Cadophora sp. MPI-SDFR-AT-0126]|nr:guanine-N(7)-methyltransferase domain-containing protein [Leotiomycetes sp. MPI-SDFR-AT-0126]
MAPLNDSDEVRSFYNSVENLGADFRKNESRIKGLRAFNNWIKCALIHKFAVIDDRQFVQRQGLQEHATDDAKGQSPGIHVLEIGLYVGLDPAEISIQQAQERWEGYQRTLKYGNAVSRAEFYTQDCFGKSLERIPAVREIGFAPGIGAGFDIASMMFCMHYAFENETTVRMMFGNITSALKPCGRLIGCVPSSKVISKHIREFEATLGTLELGEYQPSVAWGNEIYNVRFPGKTPVDGVFGSLFGDRYFFSLAEAVEAPEYVVPWELFCELAGEYDLKLKYCKPFDEVWEERGKMST